MASRRAPFTAAAAAATAALAGCAALPNIKLQRSPDAPSETSSVPAATDRIPRLAGNYAVLEVFDTDGGEQKNASQIMFCDTGDTLTLVALKIKMYSPTLLSSSPMLDPNSPAFENLQKGVCRSPLNEGVSEKPRVVGNSLVWSVKIGDWQLQRRASCETGLVSSSMEGSIAFFASAGYLNSSSLLAASVAEECVRNNRTAEFVRPSLHPSTKIAQSSSGAAAPH